MSNVKNRMIDTLLNGIVFSTAQARAWFGIQNVSARIFELRNDGYSIFTNFRKNKTTGEKTVVYRYGTAPKSAYNYRVNAFARKMATRDRLVGRNR